MDKIKPNVVDLELWDHYSGLPNPLWYQYLEEQEEIDGEVDYIVELKEIDHLNII